MLLHQGLWRDVLLQRVLLRAVHLGQCHGQGGNGLVLHLLHCTHVLPVLHHIVHGHASFPKVWHQRELLWRLHEVVVLPGLLLLPDLARGHDQGECALCAPDIGARDLRVHADTVAPRALFAQSAAQLSKRTAVPQSSTRWNAEKCSVV